MVAATKVISETSTVVENVPAKNASAQEQQDDSGMHPLEEGYQRLYSYFPPRLDGGEQEITITQTIHAGGATDEQGKTLPPRVTKKTVLVDAPQFSLPEGCVHSVNPPSGGVATANTLPHMVFTDPHLPWERRIEEKDDETRRERMPWLALLVFSQEELRIPNGHLQGHSSLFAATSLAKDGDTTQIQQSSAFTLSLTGSDIQLLRKGCEVISPIPDPDDAGSQATCIFLRPDLFTKLVSTYENRETTAADGKTVNVVSTKEGQTAADVSRFKYFAHVRHVKTSGMAASAQYTDGLFSVILSHRVGPLSSDNATPAVVHLVSLEGWKDMKMPIPSKTQYVAVSSLHSWTYTAVPAGNVSLKAEFQSLRDNIGVLRAPQSTIDAMEKGETHPVASKLAQRLRDGYTMQRHRTRTGEVTSAFCRAALVPMIPAELMWKSMSNCGSDLQILDPDTGMMDITYSAAWSLGKTLALADVAFATALTRLWNSLHGFSLDGAKRQKLAKVNGFQSKARLLESLKESIATLSSIQEPSFQGIGSFRSGRQEPSQSDQADARQKLIREPVELAIDDATIRRQSEKKANERIRRLAGTRDENGMEYEEGQVLYNELNGCVSAEWKTVLAWIKDRMFLFGIPSQYLVADPSFLPPESIRFFHIDPNWMDALIDGALSLGCHMQQNDDYIRRSIKGAVNAHLGTTDPATGFRPQIPSYGMLLRSDLVSRFPDLKVQAPIPLDAPEPGRAPILRQEIIGSGVLLCLFDRVPCQDEDMPVLALTQPPHQQTFELGHVLTQEALHIKYKRSYTVSQARYDFNESLVERCTERKYESLGSPVESGPPLFLWGTQNDTRLLLADIWAADVVGRLRQAMPSEFTDEAMTSAVAAFQLGTPIYRFCIGNTASLESLTPPLDVTPRKYRLQLLERMQNSTSGMVPLRLEQSVALVSSNRMEPLIPLPYLQAQAPHLSRALACVNMVANPDTGDSKAARIRNSDETVTRPKFDYSVYAIDGPRGCIKTGEGYPLDLIFAITREDDASLSKDYWIKEIVITVPRGPGNRPDRANLLDDYTGPGPTMLSNLRFHVLAESTEDHLILRLKPRSRQAAGEKAAGVHIDRVRECSFLLPLVNVHNVQRDIKAAYAETWGEPLLEVSGRTFQIQLRH